MLKAKLVTIEDVVGTAAGWTLPGFIDLVKLRGLTVPQLVAAGVAEPAARRAVGPLPPQAGDVAGR